MKLFSELHAFWVTFRNYKIKCLGPHCRWLHLTWSISTFYSIVTFSRKTTNYCGTSFFYHFHLSSVELKITNSCHINLYLPLLFVFLHSFSWSETEERERRLRVKGGKERKPKPRRKKKVLILFYWNFSLEKIPYLKGVQLSHTE